MYRKYKHTSKRNRNDKVSAAFSDNNPVNYETVDKYPVHVSRVILDDLKSHGSMLLSF